MKTQLYNDICRYLRDFVRQTEWEGHIFAVGGCIRDEILGLEIKDIDIAVDIPGGGVGFAKWLHKKNLTKGRPIYFEKYGTAKLTLRRFPNDEIETVQTRAEKYTKETSRCPEVVAGTIEDDCYRRDFTVNTLYRDLSTDRVLDITGHGVEDIRAGVLRTPMNPEITFDDDPVRILRCLRFAARFGWEIEPEVMEALLHNIPRLEIVSKERHRTELGKMLSGPNPVKALELLQETGATQYMLPLLRELASDKELWGKALQTVGNVGSADLPLRMAALLYDSGKLRAHAVNKRGQTIFTGHDTVGADMVRRALRGAKFEPSVYEEVSRLVRLHHAPDEWGSEGEDMTDRQLRKLQSDCGSPEVLAHLTQLYDAIHNGGMTSQLTRRILSRTDEMIADSSSGFSSGKTAQSDSENKLSGQRRRRRRHKHNDSRRRSDSRRRHRRSAMRSNNN